MLITNLSLVISDWLDFQVYVVPYFFALFFTIGGLSSLCVGWWSDSIGQRLIFLRFFSVLSATGLIALSLVSNVNFQLLLIIVTLAPSGVLVGLFFGLLVASGFDSGRVVAARAWYSATWVIGPALGAWCVSALGFQGLIFVMLALALTSCLISFRLQEEKGPGFSNQSQTMEGVFKVGDKILVVFLLQGAMSITTIALPQVMKNELGGSQSLIGIAFSVCAACEVLFMLALAKFVNKFTSVAILMFGVVFGISYYVLFSFATSTSQLSALQILNAVYIAVVMGVGLTWFQSAIPTLPTLATVIFINCYNAGAIFVSGVTAILVQQDWKFQQVGLVGAILIIFAAIILLRYAMKPKLE